MPCCGKQRGQFHGIVQTQQTHESIGSPKATLTYYYTAFFEYIGKTGLTVIGPITGKRYRFEWPGSIVEVDLRDRPSLAKVPHLREVRNP